MIPSRSRVPHVSPSAARSTPAAARPVLAPRARPHSAPANLPTRGYAAKSWGDDKIYSHAIAGIHAGGTGAMKTVCGEIVRKWKQEADRSKMYNMLPSRKVEGKSIGNRLEFTEFMTTKVFSNFADHMSPKWQNLFKFQLKDLQFNDAYDLYGKMCDLSKEYSHLVDELQSLQKILNKIEESGEPLTEEQFNMYLRTIAIKRLQEGLNAKMGEIASDCILRTSVTHAKKVAKFESKPAQKVKKQEMLEKETGMTTKEMQGLTVLQSEYVKKVDELAQIDKLLYPKEYALKEEECRNCMEALLNIIKINPTEMAEIAFKFERKYRTRAGQKIDPDHYVFTEYKYLTELQHQAMTFLLIVLMTSVAGWLVFDKLNQARHDVENEFIQFIDKASSKQHEISFDLAKLRQDLDSFNFVEQEDLQAIKQGLEEEANEIENMNIELKNAIQDYQKACKDHLEMNEVLKNLHKISDYKNYNEFLKHSNEELAKKGNTVIELTHKISKKYIDLRKDYQNLHFNVVLDRCEQDIKDLEKRQASLPPTKKQKIIFFKTQLIKFKQLDPEKIGEKIIKKFETLANHIHLWKKKELHQEKLRLSTR